MLADQPSQAWTEKFDRWWAEYTAALSDQSHLPHIRSLSRAAFMAGAAAERAEHVGAEEFLHDGTSRVARPLPDTLATETSDPFTTITKGAGPDRTEKR